jgi:drug/metabolite transporter (DMT)-like permease
MTLRKGVPYALSAGLLYAVVGTITKIATAEASVSTVAFFRQTFGLFFLLPLLGFSIRREGLATLKPNRPWLMVLRGFVSLSAMYALLFALKLLPVSDAILLSYTRPLWLPIIVLLFLRKRVEPAIWLGLALGFIGVLLVLKPGGGVFEWGAFAGLLSGILGACAFLLIRRLGRTETSQRIMAFHFTLTMLLTLLPMALFWDPFPPIYWAILVLIGLLGVLYQFCLTQAYRHTRSTIVSGLLYSAVIFGLILDALIWGQYPDLYAVLGIILICSGSIVAIVWQRERITPGEQSTESTTRRSPQ